MSIELNERIELIMKRLNVAGAPRAVGPYSHGTIFENILYTSGIIPLDPVSNEIIAGGIEEQTRRVLENLKILLDETGKDCSAVIKNNLFIQDMNHFGKINSIYEEYFSDSKPARSCVEVSRLPKDVLIEIESIVALK